MNRFLLAVLLVLGMAGVVQAAPFLVCDPFPAGPNQPTEFAVTMDSGSPVVSAALKNPDGTVILHHDISGIASGNHTVTIKSRINDPLWGLLESGPSSPFAFPKPATPGVAVNIKLSTN